MIDGQWRWSNTSSFIPSLSNVMTWGVQRCTVALWLVHFCCKSVVMESIPISALLGVCMLSPTTVRFSLGFSSFLPQYKDMCCSLTGISYLFGSSKWVCSYTAKPWDGLKPRPVYLVPWAPGIGSILLSTLCSAAQDELTLHEVTFLPLIHKII